MYNVLQTVCIKVVCEIYVVYVLVNGIERFASLTIGRRQPGRSSKPLGVLRVMSMKMNDAMMSDADISVTTGVMLWKVVGEVMWNGVIVG